MVATAARLVGGTKQAIAFAKRRHALWKVLRLTCHSADWELPADAEWATVRLPASALVQWRHAGPMPSCVCGN